MKAKIIITPKKAVLDPQGKTVQNAWNTWVTRDRRSTRRQVSGNRINLATTEESAREQLDQACPQIPQQSGDRRLLPGDRMKYPVTSDEQVSDRDSLSAARHP
jgi:phosphoribosylformylglycinamidine (FGAM) synthase PurS component